MTSSAPSNATTPGPNTTLPMTIEIIPPCKWILYEQIMDSRVRVWDLAILIPNAFFLLFLLLKVKGARIKLARTSSPVFSAFFILVFVNAVTSVVRCVVSMTVNAAVPLGDITDKVLWLILRFFLLATEMSVVIFGLAFGHLDSKSSIKRVVVVTSGIALAYSVTQGGLEIAFPDDRFHVHSKSYDIFAHGGMAFWFISSLIFFLVYSIIYILPYTPLSHKLPLPSKRSFYTYCLFLSILDLVQAVGSGLLLGNVHPGMCMIDVTTYVYFTCFTPLVYKSFLSEFFGNSQPSVLFSYKTQVDETVEDQDNSVSLPHQNSVNSKTDMSSDLFHSSAAMTGPGGLLYDSTHFNNSLSTPDPSDSPGLNPLYSVNAPTAGESLQQPEAGVNFSGTKINPDAGSNPFA